MTNRSDESFSAAPEVVPESLADLRAHIEKHIGPIGEVRGAASNAAAGSAALDICYVPPSETRPVHTFITAGMSATAMPVPAGIEAPRYLELMVTLPPRWKVTEEGDEWQWPMRQLAMLAELPGREHRWLGWGHTVPNGDPPVPFARGTRLCGLIIAPSLIVPTGFYELALGERRIAFFSIIPLYREELELERSQGMEALLARLVDRNVNDVVDPRRRNVARRRLFGLMS